MSLSVLLDLLKQFVDAVKTFIKKKEQEKIENAVDESLEKKDTRIIEEALGGSAGPVDASKYPGVYERERKKKE